MASAVSGMNDEVAVLVDFRVRLTCGCELLGIVLLASKRRGAIGPFFSDDCLLLFAERIIGTSACEDLCDRSVIHSRRHFDLAPDSCPVCNLLRHRTRGGERRRSGRVVHVGG